MDDPLVPEAMSPMKKNMSFLFLGGTVILSIVTLVLSLLYGTKPYHGGFIVIALALGGIIASTMIMLRWVRAGDMEDKVKYLYIFQNVIIVLLCVGLLIAMNTTVPENCPTVSPPTCNPMAPIWQNCYDQVTSLPQQTSASQCTASGAAPSIDYCFNGNKSYHGCLFLGSPSLLTDIEYPTTVPTP